jgi:hypothetical protein
MTEMLFDRELHEECGVFGVFNIHDAAELSYYGLACPSTSRSGRCGDRGQR